MPAVTFTVALPVLSPLQFMLLPADAVIEGPPALDTAAVAVLVHPFASVTVTVYEPATRFDAVAPDPPVGLQRYVSAPVPPLAFTEADPFAEPHVAAVDVVAAVIAGGSVIVMFAALIHPVASVTVTV